MELFEPGITMFLGPDQPTEGSNAIREGLAGIFATNPTYSADGQRPSLASGSIALTSAVLAPSLVTAEVARRQPDGAWKRVIDNPDFLPKEG